MNDKLLHIVKEMVKEGVIQPEGINSQIQAGAASFKARLIGDDTDSQSKGLTPVTIAQDSSSGKFTMLNENTGDMFEIPQDCDFSNTYLDLTAKQIEDSSFSPSRDSKVDLSDLNKRKQVYLKKFGRTTPDPVPSSTLLSKCTY